MYIYKKSVEPVTAARSTRRGLRIAHPVRTSNAEAHADMFIAMTYRYKSNDTPKAVIKTYPMNIYRCFVL